MKLINNWQDSWKLISVQLMVIIGVVAGLEQYVPHLAHFLPEGWVSAAMAITIFARLVKQSWDGRYER